MKKKGEAKRVAEKKKTEDGGKRRNDGGRIR